MSGVRALASEEFESPKQRTGKKDWSHSQGVYFSGGLLALLVGGVLAGVTITFALKLDVEDERVKEVEESLVAIDDLEINETWDFWSEVMDGQPLGEWTESQIEINRRWRRALFAIAIPCAVIAVIGLGCMIYSIVNPAPATRKPRKKPSTS